MRLTEQELRDHLEGRQTIGIYPLLRDETCRLVAIDFDGRTWREDAGAARDAAVRLDVPVLLSWAPDVPAEGTDGVLAALRRAGIDPAEPRIQAALAGSL